MAENTQIRDDVCRILTNGAEFKYTSEVADDAHLMETGVVDSFDMITLTVRLEEHFKVPIGPDDTTPENFESVKSISTFFARKLSDATSGD